MPPLDRRRFLAASAASLPGTALLAGCSALGAGGGGPELAVTNERDAAVQFRLEVAKTDPGTVVFQEDLSLDAGASESFEPDLESAVPYQVVVTTGEGRDGGEVTLEGGSSRIDVRIGDDVTVSLSSD
ncbi:hypothetical protein ACFQE1_08695 [Halobium palmae]|uniref:Ig-like domain-containing protein n=1 Tax=Halobium palmae TaxID=1776492 RepID=A0ABD5RYB1_9EURY